MDTRTIGTHVAHQSLRRLNPFNLAKLRQLAKEKPVSATHIEDSFPSVVWLPRVEHLEDRSFPRTPPPVALV